MNWLGAILVVGAGYALGGLLSAEEKKRVCALDSLLSFFNYMQRRVAESRLPITEIFLRFEDAFLEQTGFLARLRFGRGNIGERMTEALELIPIGNETEEELRLFASELGSLSLPEQEKRINVCISFLSAEREKERLAFPAKQKSIKTVCLLAGALTAIVLL